MTYEEGKLQIKKTGQVSCLGFFEGYAGSPSIGGLLKRGMAVLARHLHRFKGFNIR